MPDPRLNLRPRTRTRYPERACSPWPGAVFVTRPDRLTRCIGSYVTTSNSIVTIPIIDTCTAANCFPATGQPLTIVGYLQAFINQVQDGTGGTTAGDINITVLNIAGCSEATTNAANPVVGGSGNSPIPVRLITPP